MDANKTIAQAVNAFNAGRADEGQQLLEKVLKYQPTNQQAVRLLAQIQQQTPRALVSVETLKRVVEAQPQNPVAHELLANFLIASDPRAAERSVRASLRINPNSASTFSLLGETLLAQQRHADAAEAFRMAIRLGPKSTFPIVRLAEVLRRAGRSEEAVDLLRRAGENLRDSAELRHALGSLLRQLDRHDEAEAAFRDAIAVKPDYLAGHGSLGMLLQEVGRFEDAERVFRDALQAMPSQPRLHTGLGYVLINLKQYEEAEQALRRALEMDGRELQAALLLSTLFGIQGRLIESAQLAQRAAQAAQQSADAQTALGQALHALGLSEQATPALLRGWQLSNSPLAGSTFLYNLNYVTNVSPEDVTRAHQSWAQRYTNPMPLLRPHPNERDPERRLKIAYLIGDVRRGGIDAFLEPLLIGHDRERVEVYCYSSAGASAEVLDRLKSRADHWRDLARTNDLRAADMIREDGIDVLVELAGHAPGNRLGVVARRPAPVAVSYAGYPATTGMSAIAHRITDEHVDPPGTSEALHTEALVRLPRAAVCWQAPEPAPDVTELPARATARITFASFNPLPKIGVRTMQLWSRIVNAVPGARLVLRAHGLADAATAKHVREQFAKHGLAEDRLVLAGPDEAQSERLQRYAEVDIALESFPHHAPDTTCEALWMGVPMITLTGASSPSRMGLSLLTSVGLGDLTATSDDALVEVASNLAKDIDRLAELRRTLRDRMRGSPLLDAAGLCRAMEDAYRQMWRDWCATPVPGTAPGSIEGGWQPVGQEQGETTQGA